jgi:spore coat protein U-like protein
MNVLKKSIRAGLVGLALVSFSVTGAAADFAVSANIADNCTINASAGLDFGPYDPIVTNVATNRDVRGSVSVTCTDQASWEIRLGQGSNANTGSSDALPLRQMTDDDSTDVLAYFLYSDSVGGTVWGNTTGTGKTGTGTGAAQANTVYGRITMNQQVEAGAYTDTVVATVDF